MSTRYLDRSYKCIKDDKCSEKKCKSKKYTFFNAVIKMFKRLELREKTFFFYRKI